MANKFLVFGIPAIVIAAVVGWYFASPGLAMMQLRDAAQSGDEVQLEESIDFPRLRDGLKADLKARMAAEVVTSDNVGMEALGSALGLAMIDPIIDGFVTPETMAALVRKGRLESPDQKSQSEQPEAQEAEWAIEREGISRFSAQPDSPDGEEMPKLIFERDGLGWKLVELDLPEGTLDRGN
ncbi:DUF2939 domain-containing protein [Erythrobacter crassostreae]|uniref:DUF2939 domain-containing protein n=1 Tax=Erythrobacter crassostreae TaxID=2828328 RepID=A0A9X1JKL2_9SPHN|nr:DUF2939 domain-containing protein [Erythrobacter crassostrea]MBV7259180.1 DUF2939 domain-containing protein [Erythrobacter crassostrea]